MGVDVSFTSFQCPRCSLGGSSAGSLHAWLSNGEGTARVSSLCLCFCHHVGPECVAVGARQRDPELPWGARSVQAQWRFHRIFNVDLSRGRLHPGLALVDDADLLSPSPGKTQAWRAGYGRNGLSLFAKPDFSGTDKFSLMVVGKNLRDEGYSTVEITVSSRDARLKFSAMSQ